ncbi:unnamed protein product [Rotaria magnacalcarata]|nr:unnamed protein product [Rotaria magnacalcarata]CAF4123986.1 unnamed protein product [Rotaria magnacalcarata]CAF4226224.1 unnamed protein product [Rotaria magnacalcarata]
MSRGLCHCCQQNLCLQHFSEYNKLSISHLNQFNNETNILDDRLKTLNIFKIIGNSRRKLEQWREDCYTKIDLFFEQKCQELDRLANEKVNRQRDELNRIQMKLTEFNNAQQTTRQDIDLLISRMSQIRSSIMDLEETCFKITTHPLILNDTFIDIKKTNEHDVNLSSLSHTYKAIHRPEGGFQSLACDGQHLLIHQHPNLCLFDRDANIVTQTVWSYGEIHEMCWSVTLGQFIVLGANSIFCINENTMSIQEVDTIRELDWISCTCSETVLFVATNECASSIMEYILFPAIEFVRERKHPLVCKKDEFIVGVVYNNANLALMVMNMFKKSIHMELRNAKTLDRIWLFQPDIVCTQKITFRCCSLTCDQWLIVDYETGRLLQITKDGKIKETIKYYPCPYRAILFDQNKLVLSGMNGVHLHTIHWHE